MRALPFLMCCWLCYGVEPAAVEVKNAVHVLGLAKIGRNVKGTLSIGREAITFRTEAASEQIASKAISEVTIEHETRSLVGGTAGKLISLGPFGSGRIVSMIRPGVDTITIQFADSGGAQHGCILALPKGAGVDLEELLKSKGVTEGAPAPLTTPAPTVPSPAANVFKPERLLAASILIEPVTSEEPELPAEFRVAIYEQFVEGLEKSHLFLHVSRAGDKGAYSNPNFFTLRTTIASYKKGNERVRSLTPFGGATVIKARIQVLDAREVPVLDREITGSVRMMGENLDAAGNLTKRVLKLLRPKS